MIHQSHILVCRLIYGHLCCKVKQVVRAALLYKKNPQMARKLYSILFMIRVSKICLDKCNVCEFKNILCPFVEHYVPYRVRPFFTMSRIFYFMYRYHYFMSRCFEIREKYCQQSYLSLHMAAQLYTYTVFAWIKHLKNCQKTIKLRAHGCKKT